MFQTNPEICNSALRWSGAGRQLCRDRVTWDARALLWRWTPLHTQLWQEVRATLCPQSNLRACCTLHFEVINVFGSRLLLCWTLLPMSQQHFFCLSITRKSLTLKYYAKKILYFLRQQNILRSLKTFLEQPAEQQSSLEGEALVQTSQPNSRFSVPCYYYLLNITILAVCIIFLLGLFY